MAVGLRPSVGNGKSERASGESPEAIRLGLLNGFELTLGGLRVEMPTSVQRLLAFLAFQDRPLVRLYVAGTLWPETPEVRASANLRSCLWRVHRSGRILIDTTGQHLRLAGRVAVDVREVTALATRVTDDASGEWNDLESARALLALAGDVLPDWYEDWVLFKREHLRQLRLHALEALCERLTRAGRHGIAIQAGLAAVACEPLRESAHRALIRAHVAEGNHGEALRQYSVYRRILQQELGLRPSGQMEELIHQLSTSG